jgi:NADH-quinone oxidoreductase subunit D
MLLNVVPAASRDARHGALRDGAVGESILKVDVQVGYLHRGFEKMCERGT